MGKGSSELSNATRNQSASNNRLGANSNNSASDLIMCVDSTAVNKWVDNQSANALNAGTFATEPPDEINVSGVTFRNMGGEPSKHITDARTTDYISYYQSTEQAANGEWPVIEIVVTETIRKTKRGQFRTYTFNKHDTKLT